MTQYIDKYALVSKIDDWRHNIMIGVNTIPLHGHQRADSAFEYEILGLVKDFINNLEVKEVDLEKEIRAFAKMELEPIKIYDANVCITITMHQLYQCAEHFFELGIKAQKGE